MGNIPSWVSQEWKSPFMAHLGDLRMAISFDPGEPGMVVNCVSYTGTKNLVERVIRVPLFSIDKFPCLFQSFFTFSNVTDMLKVNY